MAEHHEFVQNHFCVYVNRKLILNPPGLTLVPADTLLRLNTQKRKRLSQATFFKKPYLL